MSPTVGKNAAPQTLKQVVIEKTDGTREAEWVDPKKPIVAWVADPEDRGRVSRAFVPAGETIVAWDDKGPYGPSANMVRTRDVEAFIAMRSRANAGKSASAAGPVPRAPAAPARVSKLTDPISVVLELLSQRSALAAKLADEPVLLTQANRELEEQLRVQIRIHSGCNEQFKMLNAKRDQLSDEINRLRTPDAKGNSSRNLVASLRLAEAERERDAIDEQAAALQAQAVGVFPLVSVRTDSSMMRASTLGAREME